MAINQHEQEDAIYLYHTLLSLYARLGFVSHETIDEIINRIRKPGSGCDHLEAHNMISFLQFIQTHDEVEEKI